MEMSMSIAKGNGNQKHNTRTQPHHPKNVDFSRTKDNVTVLHDDIREVYHQLFDAALEKYNARQKRNDRKIKDYYKHISNSKREKTFHELVIQIGDKDSHPDDATCIGIYKDFVEEFQKTNPTMRVFGAYIHMDEATPHLHLDYIPFTTGGKRGLEKKISNDGAIRQMGYKSWEEWKESQFVNLKHVAKKYDISREYQGNIERHRTVDGYKKEQRLIEKHLAAIEQNLSKSKIEPKKSILGKETVDYAIFRELEKENELLKAQNLASKKQYEKLEKEYHETKNKPYKQENDRLHEDNKRLREILRREEKQFNEVTDYMQKQIDQEKAKAKTLEKKANELKETNSFLIKFIHRLRLGRFMKKILEMTFSKTPIEKLNDDVFEKGLDNAKALFVEEREYEKHLLERSRGRGLGR